MRFFLGPIIAVLFVGIGLDWYIYRALKRQKVSKLWLKTHKIAAIVLAVVLVVAMCMPKRSGENSELLCVMWLLYTYLAFYLPKFLFVIFDAIGKIPQLWHRKPIKPFTWFGVALSLIVFVLMWWGALINRFNTQVRELVVEVDNLPEEFDGYRMAQFSDFHVGTYGNDTAFVSEVVDRINAVGADVILFTGDIVNRRTDEIKPFIKPLSRLSAPDGVYSILGNHDYGDYSDWETPEDRIANNNELAKIQKDMGWTLLLNETKWLHRNNDSIALIGVENVGDKPFPVYGSLAKAYPSIDDSHVKILMTHNPAHWVDSISDNSKSNIALTLSGHTHAMQIELFGYSPGVFRYKTWGGRYSDDKEQNLYVNIGLGAVGMPMRIGATPEITVITLRKSK
jgi:hypothetical protein